MKRSPGTPVLFLVLLACFAIVSKAKTEDVDATSLRGKVMCGYQGWFRCPGDAADMGWAHWSRERRRIAPETLTFEMWPDMAEYGPKERFPVPGFTYPDGRPAELFSSDNPATVLRHFQWMRDYGLDGAWLQRFLVGLPGGPESKHYPSVLRVMRHVADAAGETGRVWAISYDIAGMPDDRIFDVLTSDWKRLVEDGIVAGPRYLHQDRRPVVQVWGFYWNNDRNRMTSELANRIIDFFRTPGPYSAYLVGGGDWDWHKATDPRWQAFVHRFSAYSPWNVGNYSKDRNGDRHASTQSWAEGKTECERHGVLWLPVVYPGFGWDNLKRLAPGTSQIPRRGGRFLWEQFHALAKLNAQTVYVAMFDEVDEGTAIFKVTNSPPVQGHFVGYEGLPSDWYLRLVGEGIRMLRKQRPLTAEIPSPKQTSPELTEDSRTSPREYPKSELLIEPIAVAKPEIAGQFMVLDARDRKAFDAERVPGARWVDAAGWAKAFGSGKDAPTWSDKIGGLGIEHDGRVVVEPPRKG